MSGFFSFFPSFFLSFLFIADSFIFVPFPNYPSIYQTVKVHWSLLMKTLLFNFTAFIYKIPLSLQKLIHPSFTSRADIFRHRTDFSTERKHFPFPIESILSKKLWIKKTKSITNQNNDLRTSIWLNILQSEHFYFTTCFNP